MNPPSLPWILCLASFSCSAQTLVIGLYDYSDLSAKETEQLTETADLAFAHSGIHVVWHYCRGVLAAHGTTCEGEMQINEIAVRLQPSGPRSSIDGRMGHAVVTAEGGGYASVFVPSVRSQAAGFGMAFDLLMGYAVAHEVGHCLLGPGHSYAGLMRGAWNRKDASEMSRLSMHLTKGTLPVSLGSFVKIPERISAGSNICRLSSFSVLHSPRSPGYAAPLIFDLTSIPAH